MENADNDAQELQKAEKKRRLTTLAVAAFIAVAVVAGFVIVVQNSEVFFRPKLDVETGEKEVIEVTNDPQCRALIYDVTQVGIDFKAELPTLESILTKPVDQLPTTLQLITRFRQRLEAAKATAPTANLRFDDSAAELRKWFKHVDLELRFLEILINERLAAANAEGTVVHDANKKKSKKTPEERLDGALLATTEAFESFRVWHTGGLHPCGAAGEGETPWVPADTETKPTKSEKTSP